MDLLAEMAHYVVFSSKLDCFKKPLSTTIYGESIRSRHGLFKKCVYGHYCSLFLIHLWTYLYARFKLL